VTAAPQDGGGGPVLVWHERDGALLRVRLSRPKANVLDAAMVAALDAELTAGAAQPRLKAVLLDADGPHFSFGASVEEHLPESVAAMLSGFHTLVLRLVAFPVPVLVVVRGQCLGGGLEVAAAGHRLFAAPDARFGQPEIALGVFAPAASCLLPERMPLGAAEDLLFTGRSIDAEEAHRTHLVQQVADDPEKAALAWFDEYLAGRSAAALRQAVAAARVDLVARVRAKVEVVERQYLTGLMSTHDAVEGLTAFLQKRPPRWEDQ
jgi:cyclohexa-1,5-dienecarbonyl-CoA hydratase